jgi:hypothetical protein
MYAYFIDSDDLIAHWEIKKRDTVILVARINRNEKGDMEMPPLTHPHSHLLVYSYL